jgi:hypothetical protein
VSGSTLTVSPSERVPGAHWIGSLVRRRDGAGEKFLPLPLITIRTLNVVTVSQLTDPVHTRHLAITFFF